MDRIEALRIIKEKLPDKRYVHTLGVVETAIKLADHYHEDSEKAELAAILHDYAKFFPINEMKKIIIDQKMDPRLLEFNPELWHGPVAAYIAEKEFGIHDKDVLHAIQYHTSGRANMSLLEKIVYIADYIEPGRNFPGVEEARLAAIENIDRAMVLALKNTMNYLMVKKQPIFPDTLATYNSILLNREELF
jgi:predicted HD superfamily hydrolase involved in NAD metabolism